MGLMPSAELWPGQVDRAIFTLAQVRALSSVVRSEVFWAFSAFEPRSTNEIAVAIRRTPPTVRYHVNELLKADMLLAVETRKKRSRIEEAYVHKMVRGYTPAPPYEKEYMNEMNRGLAAILRSMEKEREACLAVGDEDTAFDKFNLFRHSYLKLSPAKIAELRKRIAELADEEWGSEDESDDGIAIHVVGYFAPTIMESQLHYRKVTGQDLAHRDDEEE